MENCCGGFSRKCKRIGGEEGEASSDYGGLFKRMRRTRDSGGFPFISTSSELQNRHCLVNGDSLEDSCGFGASDSGESFCSDRHSLASPRSSSGAVSCEFVNDRSSKSLDLEAKSSETEIETETETESSTSINSKLRITDTAPARFVGMESQPKKQNKVHRKRSPAGKGKKISDSEVDDFFSSSEKQQQRRFAEKYNFDVVKEVPLEGRYEWVRWKRSG